MDRRAELLAGVKRINKEIINERDSSEEATTIVGAVVEDGHNTRYHPAPGDSGGSVSPATMYQQAYEGSLEKLLRAQVISKRITLRTIELEAARCQSELDSLNTTRVKIGMELQLMDDILEENYGDVGGEVSSGDEVQVTVQEDTPSTEEDST